MRHRSPSTTLAVLALLACGDAVTEPATPPPPQFARVDNSAQCHVIGDASANDPKKALGTKQNPYGSLADVQAAVACKNIEVLYSSRPLDGGITLREGQKLRGHPGPGGELPVITNGSTAANGGRGVVLADKTTVSGLHITSTVSSAIHGEDVDGVEIVGNEISGYNTGRHMLHGIGDPLLAAYLPGILIDGALGGKTSNVLIRDNHLHDAGTGGITVRSAGQARAKVALRGNVLRRVGLEWANPRFPAKLLANVGIAIVGADQAVLEVRLDDTLIEDHGPLQSVPNRRVEFDGITAFVEGSATLRVGVDNLTVIDHGALGQGHGLPFGSQGVHAGVTAGAEGAVLDLEIANSHIKDHVGTGIALTSYHSTRDVSVRYTLRNNVIEGTRHPGMASLLVHSGSFADLGVPSVDTRLQLELAANRIVQRPTSFGDAFQLWNFAGSLGELRVKLEDNTLTGGGSPGRGMRFADQGTTVSGDIDAGGGALGSLGGNSIVGFRVDVETLNYAVMAENNWWGRVTGPANVVVAGSGSVDAVPFLLAPPHP